MAIEQRTIPVSPDLRDQVRAVKGERTYEEIISEWVEASKAEKL
jgi:hypothetical protein